MSRNGQLILQAGLKPLQFKNPSYVGVTHDDDIVVSDYFSKKIAVFDAHTHDLKFTYGNKAEDKKLSYPRGVAVDLDGNLLIADNYNGKVMRGQSPLWDSKPKKN